MNIQAMLKQAQKLQQDMSKAKEEIDHKFYESSVSFVDVQLYGSKKISKIKINKEILDHDDVEMLEDMIVTAINQTIDKIDKDTETKLGKFTNGMPGLF